MPEGHTVHRTANEFNRIFKGLPVSVSSPQGRFSTGAAAINASRLVQARAIGKQMFLEFEGGKTLRIHLGIYGKWQFHPDDEPVTPAVGEVRARFVGECGWVDLRGPTVCEVIDSHEVASIEARLGPDPLNPDPKQLERQRFIDRVSRSKTSIGLLLMDQSVIAGIGNVYRAEILFRAGVNPHTAGSRLSREQLVEIWDDSVKLLKLGVKHGVMITRDELSEKRPEKSERNFVYKREGLPCRNCGTHVVLELAAGRKLYWCPNCQS